MWFVGGSDISLTIFLSETRKEKVYTVISHCHAINCCLLYLRGNDWAGVGIS